MAKMASLHAEGYNDKDLQEMYEKAVAEQAAKKKKWIRFERSQWGLSASIVLFNAVSFYAGKTDHWGIGADINFYDRSLTFEIFNLYAGIEIWHSN